MHSTRHGIAVKKAILRRTEHLAVALGPGSPRSQASVPDRLGPRLVGSPIFLMSSAYTDPAPLQILLDGHSMVRSPRGFTLPALEVRPSREYTEAVMGSLGLERPELEHLLWDRLLHHELERSGKDVVVGNVPSAAPAWQRLATVWPDARHLFLISDPAAAHAAALGRGESVQDVLDRLTDLEAARQTLSGITIKDEELRADPQTQTRLICEYLELPWQLEMIYQNPQYVERAPVVPGTAELPEQLRDLAKLWGYPA